MKPKTICFDIDETLCTVPFNPLDYASADPIKGMIDLVNFLHDAGYVIYLYTGRHMTTERMTKKWLNYHGVKYDHVFFGKPLADFYVDDRAVNFNGENIEEIRNRLCKER